MRAYLYREGTDFHLPPRLDAFDRLLMESSDGVLMDEDGGRRPDPAFFTPARPEQAEVFLFPYDLGHFINHLKVEPCADFVRSLPYFQGRERRHVFSDNGDFARCLPLPVGLLKRSLLTSWGRPDPARPHIYREDDNASPRCVVTWYELPEHVAADKPHFDLNNLRYDCSFVGTYSHVLRNAACVSLERTLGRRFYNGGMDRLVLAANSFYHRDIPPEEWARRQELFRRITRDSLMVLCPPGIGPQSVRFYESLYYGRIPLLFNVGARYPMAGSIDYAAFSFTIAAEAVLRTGEIVREILAAHDRSALRERCLTACKVWNTHFSNAGRARAMAAYIHELAGLE